LSLDFIAALISASMRSFKLIDFNLALLVSKYGECASNS
jgi:hypothetical protein